MSVHQEMKTFRQDINKLVETYHYEKADYGVFKSFPLNTRQCLYVANWALGGIIYEKYLEQLTGYTLTEFNAEDLVAYIHPEDREMVKKITKGVIEHVIKTPISNSDPHLFLSFRLQKKDGSYCKILRQSSAFEIDTEGRMVSNFSLLTDISFLETSNRVEWEFQANQLDLIAFKNIVYGVYKNFYSNREKEIILLISKKMTSQQIAIQLHLSKHTIMTHRKNILRKAKSGSIKDVLLFCKKNGILE